MQATAEPAGTRDDASPPAAAEETRPVRMLVPQEPRDEYYMSKEDTLRASDLGITRHTTDMQLTTLIPVAAEMLRIAEIPENAFAYVLRLRNALRQPRCVQEAIDWGYRVPNWMDPLDIANADELGISEKTTDAQLAALVDRARDLVDEGETPEQYVRRLRDTRRHADSLREADAENAQEVNFDPKKRLGWWVVYDPENVETREERRARYLGDNRLVDMRGFAAAILRAYATVKDDKHDGDNARRMINQPAFRRGHARTYVKAGAAATIAEAEAKLIGQAQKDALKAPPPRRMKAGSSDLWYLSDAFIDGRDRSRLDEWYEFHQIKQTGRPKGSVSKRPKAATTR